MNDLRTTFEYANWAIVIGISLGLFQYFSKKYQKLSILLLLVIIPVWLIIALILSIENRYLGYHSLSGYIGSLAETLPITALFGGLTFILKYKKLRKDNLNNK